MSHGSAMMLLWLGCVGLWMFGNDVKFRLLSIALGNLRFNARECTWTSSQMKHLHFPLPLIAPLIVLMIKHHSWSLLADCWPSSCHTPTRQSPSTSWLSTYLDQNYHKCTNDALCLQSERIHISCILGACTRWRSHPWSLDTSLPSSLPEVLMIRLWSTEASNRLNR